MSNNAAERRMQRRSQPQKLPLLWLRCQRTTRRLCLHHRRNAKMSSINPHAYLSDVLGRIADHPIHKIDALLPWL